MKSQILWRLYGGYVVIILVTTSIVGFLVSRQVAENGLNEINLTLAARTEYLSEIVRPYFSESVPEPVLEPVLEETNDQLVKLIQSLGQKTNSRLTVLLANGQVIADSQELASKMDNHFGRPEIVAARRSHIGSVSRFSATLQQEMLYRALSVIDKGKLVAYVRVSLPLKAVQTKIIQLQKIVAFSAAIAAITALLIGFYFARTFTKPLINMTKAAEAISRGDFDKRIVIQQSDEIGQLASAFNRMAIASSQRMDEIIADKNSLEKILTGMVEGVIAVDQNQAIIHINQAAKKMLNISSADSTNKPVWELVHLQEINSALEQTMNTNDVVRSQIRRPTEVEDLVIDIYSSVLLNTEGSVIGAIIVLHDISQLDRLSNIRRDFVANASHELKTPITAINGLAETILDDENMPSTIQRSFIEKINIQSIRLSSLVADLISLSRLESGDIPFIEINLTRLVRLCLESARINCEEKAITVSNNATQNKDFIILGDEQALNQLVDNLMDNAIKYSDAGGKISVVLEKAGKDVTLSIKDTGIGISPVEQSRIFERFYRVDKARSRELGGTGLGLSIVKNIVEQHFGSINLDSQPGVGSLFTIRFPLSSP